MSQEKETKLRKELVLIKPRSRYVSKTRRYYSTYKCYCGKVFETLDYRVKLKVTKSCGCLKKNNKSLFKHGLKGSPEHYIWTCMKQRCFNKKNAAYKNYGGRGIGVCKEWVESFENFYSDMGPRPSNEHTIDRLDNDGDYGPTNCVWITRHEQSRNKRTNVFYTLNGLKLCQKDWAIKLGISTRTIRSRLASGQSLAEALRPNPTSPSLKRKRSRER